MKAEKAKYDVRSPVTNIITAQVYHWYTLPAGVVGILEMIGLWKKFNIV